MKFSYCFSVRITPMGWPEQTNIPPSFLDQVEPVVFTFIHFIGVCCSGSPDVMLFKPLCVPNSNRVFCAKERLHILTIRLTNSWVAATFKKILIGLYLI